VPGALQPLSLGPSSVRPRHLTAPWLTTVNHSCEPNSGADADGSFGAKPEAHELKRERSLSAPLANLARQSRLEVKPSPSRCSLSQSGLRQATGRQLGQLDQHVPGGCWVDEGDARAGMTDAGRLITQFEAFRLKLG